MHRRNHHTTMFFLQSEKVSMTAVFHASRYGRFTKKKTNLRSMSCVKLFARCTLHVNSCSFLVTFHSMIVPFCSCSFLVTICFYALLFPRCSLLFVCCSLSFPCCLLLFAFHFFLLSLVARYFLLVDRQEILKDLHSVFIQFTSNSFSVKVNKNVLHVLHINL